MNRQIAIKAAAVGLYGVGVVASGMIRYFGQDGGETGLIFGAVMGVIAIAASICFFLRKQIVGQCLAWLTVLMVGGWFVYEALIKKGIEVAEVRQLVVIVLSIVVAVVLLLPSKSIKGDGAAAKFAE